MIDLHSLAGIEQLPNLREVVLQTSMPVPEAELVALRSGGITVAGC